MPHHSAPYSASGSSTHRYTREPDTESLLDRPLRRYLRLRQPQLRRPAQPTPPTSGPSQRPLINFRAAPWLLGHFCRGCARRLPFHVLGWKLGLYREGAYCGPRAVSLMVVGPLGRLRSGLRHGAAGAAERMALWRAKAGFECRGDNACGGKFGAWKQWARLSCGMSASLLQAGLVAPIAPKSKAF